MTQVNYIQPDGNQRSIDVADGLSVMKGALNGGVDGIPAECGGACACATCQVFVDDAWVAMLEPATLLERSMIEESDLDGANLRLSCQIEVKPDLDGLIVRIPAGQR